MTTLTEQRHAGEFIVSEAADEHCREVITVLSGETLVAGEVLGKVTKAAATATADPANTGNGTMGAITVGAGSKVGVYKLTFVDPGSDAGAFMVEDPDGINIGQGDAGTEFDAGGLTFTLADGATDFAAGDQFSITVAAGSGKYVAYDQDGTNGSETAAGVLFDAVDASSDDAAGVALVRGPCQVNAGEITWPSGITTDEKNAAIAQLATLGILVR